MNRQIFREYDIRGEVGNNLQFEDAYLIGRAFAKKIITDNKLIIVGRDGRLSSPHLTQKLIEGLVAQGAEVIDIGIVPTPALYFAKYYFDAAAGIMVTGSHNPKDHNGFKFITSAPSFYGDDIRSIYDEIQKLGEETTTKGSVSYKNINEDYIKLILDDFHFGDLTIVWDPGNGAAGEIVTELTKKIKGTHIVLNNIIDGNFPNHHPDPSDPENMLELQENVLKHKADLGIAFDGDGDRIGIIDRNGKMIENDQLLAVFAKDLLDDLPGATIILDVKASQNLFDYVTEHGGNPIMWKTGHSLIKAKMNEVDAMMAGEISGHIFFRDKYLGYDDGIYAALRLLAIISKSSNKDILNPLPKSFVTPELRIYCDDARKFEIVKEVQESLRKNNIPFNDIDGIRKNIYDGWWLLRASNTQNVLVTRCEANSAESLAEVKKDLDDCLAGYLEDSDDYHAALSRVNDPARSLISTNELLEILKKNNH